MTDRPILFSAPMVRALIAGTKTQTRRTIKDAPEGFHMDRVGPTGFQWTAPAGAPRIPFTPRIQVGDRLWVRESGQLLREAYGHDAASGEDRWRDAGFYHSADGEIVSARPYDPPLRDWIDDCARVNRPSIHMPRWASRLTLIVTDVRVQRLQDISEEDALAEGMNQATAEAIMCPDELHVFSYAHIATPHALGRIIFETIWEQINGASSWAANPFVVAYSFAVERRNIDAEG